MSLSIDLTQEGSTVRAHISGEVDVSCADDLRAKLESALTPGISELSVNIKDMSYIDSTGIGVFVGLMHHAKQKHIALSIHEPTRNVLRIFTMLGLDAELGLSSN